MDLNYKSRISMRKRQLLNLQRRAISLFLAITTLFYLGTFFVNNMMKPAADSAYWDNTTTNPLTFGALPKTFPTSPQNMVTFKNFVIDNNTGLSFSLLAKYKTGANFNPNSCIIMLEDAADILSWSQKSYLKNTGATDPYLERSVYLSAHYVLGNNIDYGATVGMIPIGFAGIVDSTARFTGTFDGQGFELSNLTLTLNTAYFFDESGNPAYYYSMFSQIGTGGVVKNLGLRSPKYEEPYGLNVSLKFSGVAGYNRGTVQYCFVVSGTNRSYARDAGEICGVIHTNDGTADNIYFAGGIYNASNYATTKYNPVVFLNGSGTITNAFYDSTLFDATVNAVYGTVVSKTTALLQAKSGFLTADQWYIDNYNKQVTTYVAGYPRLQGFKYNNAANNATGNPFYIARPADLIFFSNAINAYPLFCNSNTRFFRLRDCIDMTTVSASAYTTPTNDFYANFEGTIDDNLQPCVVSHVGTGEQLTAHCIINLQIIKPVYKLISTTQYILMGLVFNSSANATLIKNINIVGGQVTLPTLLDTDANNSICSMGSVISYCANNTTLYNVHNSADITASGNGDYICKLRMGGIVGCSTNVVNATKCSNNATIDAGTHKYTSTATNNSMIGGIIGAQDTASGGTKTLTECINYGSITGLSVTANTNTGTMGISYVGGVCGYISNAAYTVDRVINYGAINPVKHLTIGSPVYPINTYIAGGLYGYGPSGPVTGATVDTRMCNKGTVMKTGNTDIPRLYFVEGNWITEIGKHSKAFKKADGRPEIIKLLKERIKIAENKIKEFKDILKTL